MASPTAPWENDENEMSCAYILDACDARQICGAPLRLDSPYCLEHHALCHIDPGSVAENARLREAEALATAVGGRRSRASGGPSRQFLRRLERMARVSS